MTGACVWRWVKHKNSKKKSINERQRRKLARGIFRKKMRNIPRTPRTNEQEDFWVTIFQHTSHSHYHHHHALHSLEWNSSSKFLSCSWLLTLQWLIHSVVEFFNFNSPPFFRPVIRAISHILPHASLTRLLFNWSYSLSVIQNPLMMLCCVQLPAKADIINMDNEIFSSLSALRVLIKFVLFDFVVSFGFFVCFCLFAEFALLSF